MTNRIHHTYAGPYLDRESAFRVDETRLTAWRADPLARWIVVWRSKSSSTPAITRPLRF
jgi:hypothetical protein